MKTKETKSVYLSFFIILFVAIIFGGIVGGLLNWFGGDVIAAAAAVETFLTTNILVIASIIFGGLFLFILIVYFRARHLLPLLETTEDEQLFFKADRFVDIGIVLSNLIMIFGFIFYGISLNNTASQEPFATPKDSVIFVILLFLLAVIVSTIMQVLLVNLSKKINPEKKGNPLDFKFSKVWLESCDEAQKHILYKASYKASQIMYIIYLAAMLLLLFISFISPIGAFPFIFTGILWAAQATLTSIYTMKYEQISKKE